MSAPNAAAEDQVRKKPATGRQSPALLVQMARFYMPSHTDMAGHTKGKAFDDPGAEHWGGPAREIALEGLPVIIKDVNVKQFHNMNLFFFF